MKKAIPIICACALALAACTKHEEIDFSGTIVDARYCTIEQANGGYVVALERPAGMGGTTTVGDVTYENVVLLYEPTRRIYVGDKIEGAFYLDDKYSRANCTVHYTDEELPEGVFTDIDVKD